MCLFILYDPSPPVFSQLKMYTVLTFYCLLQGVTFCGDSKASSLTMKNVPWHEEVSVILYSIISQAKRKNMFGSFNLTLIQFLLPNLKMFFLVCLVWFLLYFYL